MRATFCKIDVGFARRVFYSFARAGNSSGRLGHRPRESVATKIPGTVREAGRLIARRQLTRRLPGAAD
jgi:hypothetical protein